MRWYRVCSCVVQGWMLLYTSAAVYVLGERGAWRGVERQKPPYRPRSGMVWRTAAVIFLFLFFLSAIPSPVSAIVPRFLLLYYCCTIIVHTLWVRGLLVMFFCCVLCCTTAVLRSVVVLLWYAVGGWIGSWLCPRVHVFFLLQFLFPAIPAPHWRSSAYHKLFRAER